MHELDLGCIADVSAFQGVGGGAPFLSMSFRYGNATISGW